MSDQDEILNERSSVIGENLLKFKTGRELYRLRRSKGISQFELSKVINKSLMTINRYENNENLLDVMSYNDVVKVSNFLK